LRLFSFGGYGLALAALALVLLGAFESYPKFLSGKTNKISDLKRNHGTKCPPAYLLAKRNHVK